MFFKKKPNDESEKTLFDKVETDFDLKITFLFLFEFLVALISNILVLILYKFTHNKFHSMYLIQIMTIGIEISIIFWYLPKMFSSFNKWKKIGYKNNELKTIGITEIGLSSLVIFPLFGWFTHELTAEYRQNYNLNLLYILSAIIIIFYSIVLLTIIWFSFAIKWYVKRNPEEFSYDYTFIKWQTKPHNKVGKKILMNYLALVLLSVLIIGITQIKTTKNIAISIHVFLGLLCLLFVGWNLKTKKNIYQFNFRKQKITTSNFTIIMLLYIMTFIIIIGIISFLPIQDLFNNQYNWFFFSIPFIWILPQLNVNKTPSKSILPIILLVLSFSAIIGTYIYSEIHPNIILSYEIWYSAFVLAYAMISYVILISFINNRYHKIIKLSLIATQAILAIIVLVFSWVNIISLDYNIYTYIGMISLIWFIFFASVCFLKVYSFKKNVSYEHSYSDDEIKELNKEFFQVEFSQEQVFIIMEMKFKTYNHMNEKLKKK